MVSAPYRSTPVFDQETLPAALRANHSTKAGVWGLVRVLEGRLRLTYVVPPAELELAGGESGLVEPQQDHFVTPLGSVKMCVDFYHEPPER